MEENAIIQNAKLEQIDISQLMPSSLNTYDTSDIADLRGNIEACGLITPLTVIGPFDDGMYQIMSGERRFKALTQLIADGYEHFKIVPCYVCGASNMPDVERQLLIEAANLESREYTEEERNKHRIRVIRIIKAMAATNNEKHQWVLKKAEAYMSCSERYRKMYLRIIEENDESMIGMIEQGNLSIPQANAILGMNEEDRKSVMQSIEESIANGENDKDKKSAASQAIKKVIEEKQKQKEDEDKENGLNAGGSVNFEDLSEDELEDQWESLTSGMPSQGIGSSIDQYDGYSAYKDTSIAEKDKATMVKKWCEKMLQKTEYADFEEETIDVCRRVVEHFDSIE